MHNRNAGGGFTLIEVMIAVVIVAILAAVAYPTYLGQVRKSRRVDAKTTLLKAANRQERYYTTEHEYADSLDKLAISNAKAQHPWYSFAVQSAGSDSFTISANARADTDQAKDDCTTLAINQRGEKTAGGMPGNDPISQQCW